MQITNPVTSECGRFFVNPVEFYGDVFIEWAAEIAAIVYFDLIMDRDLDSDSLDTVGWNELPEDAREQVYMLFKKKIKEDM